jgi:hypothetical protein
MRKLGSILLMILLGLGTISEAQNKSAADFKVGAYYFDGWTGKTSHITPKLANGFPERKPKWGWVTSTQALVDSQIVLASGAGIDYFNFCWYYDAQAPADLFADPKNNALRLYLHSSHKKKMEFSILVANHKGYIIQKEHWDTLMVQWCGLFKDPLYLRANGKPLITFFSVKTLKETFGDAKSVKAALQRLRKYATSVGLNGVSIALCLDPEVEESMQIAQECGFDIYTGYNYHNAGFKTKALETPIASLIKNENAVRDRFKKLGVPYIPVATLNWDKRPCYDTKKVTAEPKRYVGFSEKSVYMSIVSLKDWTLKNRENTTKEHLAILYAWNEYGEGAWLTPSQIGDNKLLIALEKALR